MKRNLFVILALLLTTAAHSSPRLAFPIPSGQVTEPSLAAGERKAVMQIANAGDEPLEINKLRPSCSCVKVVPQAPILIKPGETNTFSCTLDLGGELKKGPKNYTVYVESNDPCTPVGSWFVTVPIIPCVELIPRNISFKEGEASTQTVTVIQQFRTPSSPIKAYFLDDLFGAPPDESKKPEKFLGFSLEEPLESITNRLCVYRLQKKTYSRYGTVRLSLDAGQKFNVLQIETDKFPEEGQKAE
ncbi:DUF1573 domain-containing protein [bacterium]|nr:DUF1573 domain-containing protein [bacterium]